MLWSSRIRCCAKVLSAILGVLPVITSANLNITKPPAGHTESVQVAFDRGVPVKDLYIFNFVSGGYDTSDPLKWGRNTWTCESLNDATKGACPTEPEFNVSGSYTDIKLSFREEMSGATAILTLLGSSNPVVHRACGGTLIPGGSMLATPRPMEEAKAYTLPNCPSYIYFDERLLSVKIPATELKKVPSGGIWKASLRLSLRSGGPPAPVLAVFSAEIQLNVTDKNNIQIYLPDFATVTPIVDLKLHRLPNGSRLIGTSNLDMCLYDGYSSQSTWFDISASDGLTVDRRDKGRYSVLLGIDKSTNYESRIDYALSLEYGGMKVALPNNETVRLQSVNNSAGRLVWLPGISVPVICTPTPLTFETPEFQSVWKRPGSYSNKLTITFTPSSASL